MLAAYTLLCIYHFLSKLDKMQRVTNGSDFIVTITDFSKVIKYLLAFKRSIILIGNIVVALSSSNLLSCKYFFYLIYSSKNNEQATFGTCSYKNSPKGNLGMDKLNGAS